MKYEFAVVGGGIVGFATALALQSARPGASVVLLEKDAALGNGQTGHNSGVIHSGIYYAPGSLKAKLCREGLVTMKAFCTAHGVPFENRGKLIVATDDLEMERLAALETRAGQNGIVANRLSASELTAMEPHIAGRGALHVPEAAIVDYRAVLEAMRGVFTRAGGELRLGSEVTGIVEQGAGVSIRTTGGEIEAGRLAVCGGLQADRLARLAGLDIDVRIVPFRGVYFVMPKSRANIVGNMIYPVPDPALPFLGIHLTPTIDGAVTLGPNAVLGLARERYGRGAVDLRDTLDAIGFPGFWKMAAKQWRFGLGEMWNSTFRGSYLAACQKYCPELELSDLAGYAAGIRAQAVTQKGELVSDFVFKQTPRSVHVLNAPSPAATSSLPIGRSIAERLLAG
ncbi:MAG TPA: L-2-hydroxyglutarate oxidase [Devosia sp.]|nr:L-2-hydroxyglutarate oxidase [Devosia sp.]